MSKPKLQVPNIEKLLAQAAKKEEKQKQLQEINPFGTGLKVVPNDGGIKNIQISGSTAGAGSGEFHVYRAQRRTELTRIELMNAEAAQEAVNAEFQKRRDEVKALEEKKKSKKAAKRKRAKDKAKAKKQQRNEEGGVGDADDDSDDGDDDGSEAHDNTNNDTDNNQQSNANVTESAKRTTETTTDHD